MLNKSIIAGATSALLFVAMPATAVVKIATYAGTFYDGYDYTGVFGTANSSLVGVGYVATFTYDASLGVRTSLPGSFDDSRGGIASGTPGKSPVISATVTANGITKYLAGGYQGLVNTNVHGVSHSTSFEFNDGVDYILKQISIYNYPVGSPTSLDQNFGPVAATGGWGSFAWVQNKVQPGSGPATELAFADFNYDAVFSVNDPLVTGGVPEPASWALMIAGFGIVGVALRRRETVAV